jgi:hypothetical protein
MTDRHALRDRGDVLVEEDAGSTIGTALGIVVIVGLLAAIWWFALGPGATDLTTPRGATEVVVPSPVKLLPNDRPAP